MGISARIEAKAKPNQKNKATGSQERQFWALVGAKLVRWNPAICRTGAPVRKTGSMAGRFLMP
jgi:hypothetical protein